MGKVRFEYYSHDLNSVEGSVNLYRRVDVGGEEFYSASDYATLEQRLEESESERVYYKDRLKPAFDYVDGVAVSIAEDEIDRLEQRLAEAEAQLAKEQTSVNELALHAQDLAQELRVERERLAEVEARNEILRWTVAVLLRQREGSDGD